MRKSLTNTAVTAPLASNVGAGMAASPVPVANLKARRLRSLAEDIASLKDEGNYSDDEADIAKSERRKARRRAQALEALRSSRSLGLDAALAVLDTARAASVSAEPEAVSHSPSSTMGSPLATDPRVVLSPTATAKTLSIDEEAKRVRMLKLEAKKVSEAPVVVKRKPILFSPAMLFDSTNLVAAAAARKEIFAAAKEVSGPCVYAKSVSCMADYYILVSPRSFMNCPASVFDHSSLLNLANQLNETASAFKVFPFFISKEDLDKLNALAPVTVGAHTLSLSSSKLGFRLRFAFLRDLLSLFHHTYICAIEKQKIAPEKMKEMTGKITHAFSVLMDYLNDSEEAALQYLTDFKRVATFLDERGLSALAEEIEAAIEEAAADDAAEDAAIEARP